MKPSSNPSLGETGRPVHVVLPPTLESVAVARRTLLRAARRWGNPEDICADAALVLSELVTNAVLHARTPMDVLVQPSGDGVRIEVSDTSPELLLLPPSLPSQPVAPLEDAELGAIEAALRAVTMTGRGLALVAALARSWGVTDQPPGKTVWAEIGPSSAADASPPDSVVEVERAVGSEAGVAGALRLVHLVAVPIRLMVASDRNFDELLRELQLVALDTRGSASSATFSGLADQVVEQLGSLERQGRLAVRDAIERGDRLVDLSLGANDLVLAGFGRLAQLLRMVAQEAQAGRLLTGAAPDEVVAFRRWYRDEVKRQLAGRAPVPCPFPTVPESLPGAASGVAVPGPGAAEKRARGERELARLRRVLDSADEIDTAANAVLDRALGIAGARRGLLCLRHPDGPSLRVVTQKGYPDEIGEYWREFPLGADLPASEAARTGRPVLLRTLAERDERYPGLSGTPVVDDPALACLPLCRMNGRDVAEPPLGCLVVGFAQSRTLSDDELWFVRALAELAAVWLASHLSAGR